MVFMSLLPTGLCLRSKYRKAYLASWASVYTRLHLLVGEMYPNPLKEHRETLWLRVLRTLWSMTGLTLVMLLFSYLIFLRETKNLIDICLDG